MKPIVRSVLAAMALASPAFAQNFLVEKTASYVQNDASGAVAAGTIGFPSFTFNGAAPTAATITPPGLPPITLPFSPSNNAYTLSQPFFSKSALSAAFPDGSYVIKATGFSSLSVLLGGDLFPGAIPQVTGGTWQGNVLVVDPSQTSTLNFSTFSSYAAGGQVAGHIKFKINSVLGADNVNLKNETISLAGTGLPQTSSPFTSYTIPAGALVAGNLYQGTLDFDAITALDTTTVPGNAIAGIFENETNFYLLARPATVPAAPVITSQPASFTTPLGSSATFTFISTPAFQGTGPGSPTVIWYLNGQSVPNTSKYSYDGGLDLTVNNVNASDAGTYLVAVFTAGGVAYSQPVTLGIGAATPPTITRQPQSVTVPPGGSFSFNIDTTGTSPFTYQWFLNGAPIAGATGQRYTFGSASGTNAGIYTVTATNSAGAATSSAATLTVAGAQTPPNVLLPPPSWTVPTGTTVVFSITAGGTPAPTYQWLKNGVAISGATTARLVIYGATLADAAAYTCRLTNAAGSNTSAPGSLTIAPNQSPSRLINLSVLAGAGSSQLLTIGFTTGGGGTTGSQNLLVRAAGPTLGALGVANTLADPKLTVFSGQTAVASNDNWGTPAPNGSAVIAADAATGAFPLTSGSLDAALAGPLPAGGYSVQVSGNGTANGTVIAEVYDATPAGTYTAATPRLINLSCLTNVAAGGMLTEGFIITGFAPRTVLVRASGPALTGFGIPSVMPDPQIGLYNTSTGTVLASNAGWGGDPQFTAAGNLANAFAVTTPASKDSMLLMTLPPGSYSAQATSVTNAGGNALIEVYEVP